MPSFILRKLLSPRKAELHGAPGRNSLTFTLLGLQSKLVNSLHKLLLWREGLRLAVLSGGCAGGCGCQSGSQLIFSLPDEGQALILILFLVFLYLLGVFIPVCFLNYSGFND